MEAQKDLVTVAAVTEASVGVADKQRALSGTAVAGEWGCTQAGGGRGEGMGGSQWILGRVFVVLRWSVARGGCILRAALSEARLSSRSWGGGGGAREDVLWSGRFFEGAVGGYKERACTR